MTSPQPRAKHTAPNQVPNTLYTMVEADAQRCWELATLAVQRAKQVAPKMSGNAAAGITPYWGEGFFGMQWDEDYLWYQERGTRGRTMRELAGKVIPMWIDDPTGSERLKNPKAKTRITKSGRTQVLIFRKAAKNGQRKNINKKVGGRMQKMSVPASYPGAPGRIARRSHGGYPSGGPQGIARGNVGVRWYNPGISGRQFMHNAIQVASLEADLGTPPVYAIRLR